MRRVVITGATGVIGMALINKCIEMGDEVLVLARSSSARTANIPKNHRIEVRNCPMDEYKSSDADSLKIKGGYDVFYHFAWAATSGAGRDDMTTQEVNIGYTLDAVELAARLGCRTFVGAGSQAEYGRYECDLNEELDTHPEIAYGAVKLKASILSRKRCDELRIKHIWARVLSVYGPYDGKNTMVSSIILKLLAGENAPMTAGGQIWDYIYGDDAANAFYLLADKGRDGQIYLIASGKSMKLLDYAAVIEKCVPSKGRIDAGAIPYSDKQVMHLTADISKLKRDTGFECVVTFEEGIKRTAKFLSENR